MRTGIVGAGISGLATAQAILAGNPQAEVSVLESANRPGGKVWSERTAEGYLCEWGVNAFLDKSPRTLELCSEIGLKPLSANVAAKKRYVFSEGELHKLPEKPPEFFSSRLLSLRGRLRVIGEVFAGRARKPDETLEEFGTRHLGREAFQKLIDPMASGVFAGDATRMSLKSCFPRIHEVESEYGSLIRGLISLRKKARQAGSQDTPGPGPGGLLTSFRGGMSELTDTLTAGLGDRVRFEAGVESLSLSGGKFEAHLVGGGSEEFDVVVLAAPAWAQARILRDMAPRIAAGIAGIEYPALAVVCMGYERARAGDCLDGFGFLVPSRERRGILGTVVDSNVFPERAPADRVLLRTMVGGARASQLAEEPENRILDLVRADLADILGVDADPEFVRVCRHQRAIPQYLVGHAARLESIGQGLLQYPGLFLTGNAYRGVSLNDCVLNASSTARAVLDHKGAGGARR